MVKRFLGLMRWLALGAGFMLGAVLAGWLVLWVGLHSSTVRVPSVVGLDGPSAVQALHEHGLEGRLREGVFDPKVAPGLIAVQQPAAGFQLKRGASVRLAPSLGREARRVPDLTSLPLSLAEAELDSQGLWVGRRSEVEGLADAVVVVAHSPGAASPVPPASPIALLVNRSPRIRRYVMPDFVGTRDIDAARVVRGLGFRLAEIQRVFYGGASSGLVLRQDPAAGGPVVEGAVVVLWVSQ